jgi:hypothetical protein
VVLGITKRKEVLVFDTTKPILGIDIGKVITGDTDKSVLFTDAYLGVPEIPGAFRTIAELYHIFSGQVCLVSKCRGVVQVKTRHWLLHHNFFKITGVDPNHVFFCEERKGKSPICKFLGVTHFVDGRLEVLEYLENVRHQFLFCPNEKEIIRHYKHFHNVVRVENWNDLYNLIQMTF